VAGKSAILSLKILVDQAKAATDLDKAAGKVGGFEKSIGKLAAPAGIALGAIVALGKGAMDAASDSEQAMGAVDSVFGKSAQKIKDWSDQAATSVGLSKTQYGNLAATLGAQLKNLGVPLDQAAVQTNDLIKLGADLAATYGGTTADAVGALGAAFRGEADPAERYGLALSQTAVNAALAEKGQDKLTGAALNQAKAAAILELATSQASGAVGQFARESDGAAGSAQIAEAELSNVTAELGKQLLPVAVKVAQTLSVMAKWVSENSTLVKIMAGVVAVLAAGILILNAYLKITAIVSKAAWLAGLGPIGLVIAAVLAIVAAIVVLWNKCEWFRGAVMAVWNAIRTAAEVAWRAITDVVGTVVDGIVAAWQGLVGIVRGIWDAIANAVTNALKPITTAIGWIQDAWDNTVGAISRGIDKVKGWLDGILGKLGGIVGKVAGVVTGTSMSVPVTVTRAGASSPSLFGAAAAGPARATPTGAGAAQVINITVNGAVDADGTARTITRVLSSRARRVGPVRLGGVLA
jgi:phage-related protein